MEDSIIEIVALQALSPLRLMLQSNKEIMTKILIVIDLQELTRVLRVGSVRVLRITKPSVLIS